MAASAFVTYQLRIHVPSPVCVEVGRLGPCAFPAGDYLYTGSAKRNFQARVDRHLRKEKRLRWHIDYLLGAPGVGIVEVLGTVEAECRLNRASPGRILFPGFGASDCRAGCGSHLKYLGPDSPQGAL